MTWWQLGFSSFGLHRIKAAGALSHIVDSLGSVFTVDIAIINRSAGWKREYRERRGWLKLPKVLFAKSVSYKFVASEWRTLTSNLASWVITYSFSSFEMRCFNLAWLAEYSAISRAKRRLRFSTAPSSFSTPPSSESWARCASIGARGYYNSIGLNDVK